jgi:hypothetical protein
MVTLRGLVGRRGSVLPTLLNIAQNIGWATMEIIVISTAAVAVVGDAWRWPFVILAGAAATIMAIRPLGSVRLLRKVMVWVVLAASVFLFVQVLLQPRQSIPQNSVLGFWPAVDLAIAGVISFAPLAADYSRHSRSRRAAFWGASLGYGLAAIAYYALGVFAVVNLGASDVITALVTLPAGAIAITILLVDEVDEAFANVYSTTMSVHNIVPQLDRRIIALIIGVTGNAAGWPAELRPVPVLPLLDRLGLPSRCTPSRPWTSSLSAGSVGMSRLRPRCVLRRSSRGRAGSSPYQLVYPGTVPGWADFWTWLDGRIGFVSPGWLGSSVAAIAVSGFVMLVSGLLLRYRRVAAA